MGTGFGLLTADSKTYFYVPINYKAQNDAIPWRSRIKDLYHIKSVLLHLQSLKPLSFAKYSIVIALFTVRCYQ